jgi:hypothetical protein
VADHTTSIAYEVGLGDAGGAIAPRDVLARVADRRIGDAELAQEVARVRSDVLHVQAQQEHPVFAPALPTSLQAGRLLAARITPRRPEVQHDGRAAQLLERELAVSNSGADLSPQRTRQASLLQDLERESWRRGRAVVSEPLVDRVVRCVCAQAVGKKS